MPESAAVLFLGVGMLTSSQSESISSSEGGIVGRSWAFSGGELRAQLGIHLERKPVVGSALLAVGIALKVASPGVQSRGGGVLRSGGTL